MKLAFQVSITTSTTQMTTSVWQVSQNSFESKDGNHLTKTIFILYIGSQYNERVRRIQDRLQNMQFDIEADRNQKLSQID